MDKEQADQEPELRSKETDNTYSHESPPGAIVSLENIKDVASVLSKEIRLKILLLVREKARSVKEIAALLKIPLSTATVNIKKLESVGVIAVENVPGIHGVMKLCSLKYDYLLFRFDEIPEKKEERDSSLWYSNPLFGYSSLPVLSFTHEENNGEREKESSLRTLSVSLPVGHYASCITHPTCGLLGPKRVIGKKDVPQSFYLPERVEAILIWGGKNSRFEYHFPISLPPHAKITGIEYGAEICSEFFRYRNHFPSDITLWINGKEVGTWQSPGDFGGIRGRYTPHFWSTRNTQFGLWTVWKILEDGIYINGVKIRSLEEEEFREFISTSDPFFTVRIGVKDNATHRGGINLFGKDCGNFNKDPTLTIYFRMGEGEDDF